MFGEVQRRRYYDVSLLNMVDIVASMKPNMGTDTIGKHVFMECWATYKHTSLTVIDWGEILALKLWSQNFNPHVSVVMLRFCEVHFSTLPAA